MAEAAEVIARNLRTYEQAYSARRYFPRYPADWIIRFHNSFCRANIPSGRVLDYGCGAANNSRFFLDRGYEVHGTEITEKVLPLIRENMGRTDRFTILSAEQVELPFADGYFDIVVANQVLYYCGDEARIKAVATEIKRVLRPGGVIFVTTIGPKNSFIAQHGRPIGGNLYHARLGGDHRLTGHEEICYVVETEGQLLSLFEMFEPVTVGYFDQSMFDMKSNFHWIFCGRA